MIAQVFRISLAALLALSAPLAFAQKAPKPRSSSSPQFTSPSIPDLVFRAMPLCRVFNAGPIAANGSRDFLVSGADPGNQFAAQGGTSGGCGIPASATAVAISLTSVSGSGIGGLVAYAQGATKPAPGRVVSYTSNMTYTTGAAIVPLANNKLTVSSISYTVQGVAGDVIGYYVPQIEAYVYSNANFATKTSRVLSVGHSSGTGEYVIAVDTAVDSCSVVVTTGVIGAYASGYTSGLSAVIDTWILSSTAVATAHDEPFQFAILC